MSLSNHGSASVSPRLCGSVWLSVAQDKGRGKTVDMGFHVARGQLQALGSLMAVITYNFKL